MQDITETNNEEQVLNPCWNCPHDTPYLCDCEVCDMDEAFDDYSGEIEFEMI